MARILGSQLHVYDKFEIYGLKSMLVTEYLVRDRIDGEENENDNDYDYEDPEKCPITFHKNLDHKYQEEYRETTLDYYFISRILNIVAQILKQFM